MAVRAKKLSREVSDSQTRQSADAAGLQTTQPVLSAQEQSTPSLSRGQQGILTSAKQHTLPSKSAQYQAVPSAPTKKNVVLSMSEVRQALLPQSSSSPASVVSSSPDAMVSEVAVRRKSPRPRTDTDFSAIASLGSSPPVVSSSPHPMVTDVAVRQKPPSHQVDKDKNLCLPAGWKTTLPKADQQWVSKSLFTWSKRGTVQLKEGNVDKLWWYPPQPRVSANTLPEMDKYFAQPLFLWMPRKMWKLRLESPHPDCGKRELTSAGLHQKVRQVTDIDRYYNIASEYLQCPKCHNKVIAWSHGILSQIDVGHRVQFPCLLTAKLACDIKVVRLVDGCFIISLH